MPAVAEVNTHLLSCDTACCLANRSPVLTVFDLSATNLTCTCRVFGWTPKNEITNGRWVMFGFGVGLLTEYATGVDFINQLKLMVSYLGIADIYD